MSKGRRGICKGCPCLDCGVGYNNKRCAYVYYHSELRKRVCFECTNEYFPCVSGGLDRVC